MNMKMRLLSGAVAIALAWPGITSANSTVSYGHMEIIGHGGSPDLSYDKRINLISGSASSGFNVGCNGMTMMNVAAQAGAKLDMIAEYVQGNWQNIAINYLIYSSPTLYQVIENMNKHIEEALAVTMVSCQSIRQRAIDKTRAGIAAAEARCNEETGSPELCNDGDVLDEYVTRIQTETSAAWRDTKDDLTSQVQEIWASYTGTEQEGAGPPPTDNARITGEKPVDLIVLSGGVPGNLVDDFLDLYPSRTINDATGDSVWETRKTTPREIYLRYYNEYLDALVTLIVAVPGDAGDFRAALDTYNEDPFIKPLDTEFAVDLHTLNRMNKTQYDYAVSSIAQYQALARVESQMSLFERAVLHGSSNGAGVKIDKEDLDHFIRSSQYIKAEVAAITEELESKNRQREQLMSIAGYVNRAVEAARHRRESGM